MFTARATEAWGAPDTVQAAFLLELRLDLLSTTEPVYLGRERGCGRRFWIKCSDGTPESSVRLAREKALLPGLEHPHILPLITDIGSSETPWLIFHWQGEEPLTQAGLDALPPSDRVRLAADLLETIRHLQATSQLAAHGRLELENLWLTPAARWLRLYGFGHAVAPADNELLRADRLATADLLAQILDSGVIPAGLAHGLQEAMTDWVDGVPGACEQFQATLKRAMLSNVTMDL